MQPLKETRIYSQDLQQAIKTVGGLSSTSHQECSKGRYSSSDTLQLISSLYYAREKLNR